MNKKIIGLLCILFLFPVSKTCIVNAQDSRETFNLTEKGRELSSTQVKLLEKKLITNPNDLPTRIMVLAYYFENDESLTNHARQKHILWIIENHPESEIAGEPECQVIKTLNRKDYQEAKELWLKQIERQKNNPAVFGNAVSFFLIEDRRLAERLLKQVEIVEPNNLRWPEELGHLYLLNLLGPSDDDRHKIATQALEKFERALSLANDDLDKAGLSSNIAKAAFEAGMLDKAKIMAQGLLDKYGQIQNDSYDGAICAGNQILGRVALRKGDITEAKARLIASAKMTGSPTLTISGPDMTLAKALLKQGEKDTVIDYLHLCAKFWELEDGQLQEWEDAIVKGEIPDFNR